MVLTTLIILILIGCFINGHRKGLLMMALYTGTYIVSWLIARSTAPRVGTLFSNFLPDVSQSAGYSSVILQAANNNTFFYNGVAFLVVFIVVAFLCHWGINKLRWIKRVPIIGTLDQLAGGLLSLVIGYVVIFVVLVVLQLWPAGWWQTQMASSGLAQLIINQTPGLAQMVLATLK